MPYLKYMCGVTATNLKGADTMNCEKPNLMIRSKTLRDCKWRFAGAYTGVFHDKCVPYNGKLVQLGDGGEIYDDPYYDYRLVPCGKCPQCLASRSRVWTERCIAESLSYDPDTLWFLTLTYDDDHIPLTLSPDKRAVQTLRSRDFTNFMKRLRERVEPERIRFFGCGEYGSQTFRPHYHVIIFGLPRDTVQPQFLRKNGDYWYYTSPLIEAVWKDGYHIIAPASTGSMAYVARYTTKKIGKGSADYVSLGIEREFVRMSRRPAIGSNFYRDVADKAFQNVSIAIPDISCDTGRRSITFPRSMKEKFWTEEQRKSFSKRLLTNVNMDDILEAERSDADFLDRLKAKSDSLSSMKYTSERDMI